MYMYTFLYNQHHSNSDVHVTSLAVSVIHTARIGHPLDQTVSDKSPNTCNKEWPELASSRLIRICIHEE